MAEQADLGAGAPCGQRLIGAFAAGKHLEAPRAERLARQWQARDPRDEIEIECAEDDDHRLVGAGNVTTGPCVRRAASVIRP
ncbi:MAG TPA: hypothetical protein VGR63_06245 [Casimicrobiaceae bacterium]|nr:hypothetical protein [Casimicrobiaceae bacterium]